MPKNQILPNIVKIFYHRVYRM